jgi:competence protein ComFB
VGRIFNGLNFEPLSEAKIELRRNGDLVSMRDASWQNPFDMVANTEGMFTFWPTSIPAESANTHKVFEFSVKLEALDLEPLIHFFTIPVTSEIQAAEAYSMERSFRLPDLYMFPPSGAEEDF